MTSRELIYLSSGQNSVLNIFPKMCLVWPECIHVHVPVCTFNYILQCKFKTCPFVHNIQEMFPSLGRTMRSPVAGKSSVNEWIFTMDEFIRENTNLTTNLRFYSLPVYHCSVLNFACTKRSLSLQKKNNFTACNKLLHFRELLLGSIFGTKWMNC